MSCFKSVFRLQLRMSRGYRSCSQDRTGTRHIPVLSLVLLGYTDSSLSNEAMASLRQFLNHGTASSSSTSSLSIITKLNDHDVLQGRGAGIDRCVGNVRFRTLIKSRKDDYLSAHQAPEKNRIARDVIDAVQASHGRFLRRVCDDSAGSEAAASTDSQLSGHTWVVMEDMAILDKVKQAFRDCCLPNRISRDKHAHRKKAAPKAAPRNHIARHDQSRTILSTDQSTRYRIATSEKQFQNPAASSVGMPTHIRSPSLSSSASSAQGVSSDVLTVLQQRAVELEQMLENQQRKHQLQQQIAANIMSIDRQQLRPGTYRAAASAAELVQASRHTALPPLNVAGPSATFAATTGMAPFNINPSSYVSHYEHEAPLQLPHPGGDLSKRPGDYHEPLTCILGMSSHHQQQQASSPHSTTEVDIDEYWREIPSSYLLLMNVDDARVVFRGDDLVLLLRTKRLAELAPDFACLQQIRAVWQLVLALPPSRRRLSPTEQGVMGRLLMEQLPVPH